MTPLLPKNSNDVAAAQHLVELGYPAVEPVLKSLFQWLETSGSPVEMVMRRFFAELGAPALDLVRDALTVKIKPVRKHALLRFVLPFWPRSLIAELEQELMALVHGTDVYGLDIHALSLLMRNQVGHAGELESWYRFKTQRLEEHLEALRAIPSSA
ncbi:hypothetical protein ASE28_00285 [Acidovorax sp. Root219]|nr:hypothetical protein ASE28_00285 [Acidovorax sp. Root219]